MVLREAAMKHADGMMSREIQQCIDACMECHTICEEILPYAMQRGGKHAEPNLMRMLLDCAELCNTAGLLMMRGSELHRRMCEVCAEACRRCAEMLASVMDDERMRWCMEACHRCAEMCMQVAAGAPA
jgi:hypothetical protein